MASLLAKYSIVHTFEQMHENRLSFWGYWFKTMIWSIMFKVKCMVLLPAVSFRFLHGAIESIMALSATPISTTGSAVSPPNKTTEGTWRALLDNRLEVESVRGEGEERGEEENGERQIK